MKVRKGGRGKMAKKTIMKRRGGASMAGRRTSRTSRTTSHTRRRTASGRSESNQRTSSSSQAHANLVAIGNEWSRSHCMELPLHSTHYTAQPTPPQTPGFRPILPAPAPGPRISLYQSPSPILQPCNNSCQRASAPSNLTAAGSRTKALERSFPWPTKVVPASEPSNVSQTAESVHTTTTAVRTDQSSGVPPRLVRRGPQRKAKAKATQLIGTKSTELAEKPITGPSRPLASELLDSLLH